MFSKKRNFIELFFDSYYVDAFFYAAACATIFCYGLLHWYLQYDQVLQPFFDIYPAIGMVVSAYYIIKRKQIHFDLALVLLIQVMVLVGVFDYHRQTYYEVRYTWILPVAYILGKCIALSDRENRNNRIYGVYLALAGGMFLCGLSDFGINWMTGENGWGLGTENWGTFETGVPQPRTAYELGFVLVTSFTAFAILNIRKNKLMFAFMVMLDVLIQYIEIHVQGRENTLLLLLALPVFLIVMLLSEWQRLNNRFKILILTMIGVIIFCGVIGLLSFHYNWFGLYDRYSSSYWRGSGGLFTNVRFSMDFNGFKSMLMYPLDDYYYYAGLPKSHSTVLEYGRAYGLTIFIGLTIMRLLFIKDAIWLLSNKKENLNIKMLLIPAFIFINLYFSFEPVGYQRRYFWMTGFIISGLIRGRVEKVVNM